MPALVFRLSDTPAFDKGVSAEIHFVEDSVSFSEPEKELIRGIVLESEREVREMSQLTPEEIWRLAGF